MFFFAFVGGVNQLVVIIWLNLWEIVGVNHYHNCFFLLQPQGYGW